MKKRASKFLGAALLFAVGGASVSHAVERIKTVNLNILNPAPIITLENKSNNKHISKLKMNNKSKFFYLAQKK